MVRYPISIKKSTLCVALSCILFFSSCQEKEKMDATRVPYLEVGGRYLYMEDIDAVIPDMASQEDSTALADDFAQQWATNVLLYEHASKNISDQEKIDKLVEDYRRSLIIHQYQENLIRERLADVLSDKKLEAFYNSHKEKFVLKNSIIKGVYIQVPLGAPKFSKLQGWMRNYKAKSIEEVEKYSIQNATSYQYFGDRWVKFLEVTKNMPIQLENADSYLRANRYIEVKDTAYHYILRILDVKFAGETEPFELAKDKIHVLLMNKEKTDFIKKLNDKLYQEAIDKEKITFFSQESEPKLQK